MQDFNNAIDEPITRLSQSTFVINVFLAAGLKHLWNVANVLQFVIFADAWRVNLDPFVSTLLK